MISLAFAIVGSIDREETKGLWDDPNNWIVKDVPSGKYQIADLEDWMLTPTHLGAMIYAFVISIVIMIQYLIHREDYGGRYKASEFYDIFHNEVSVLYATQFIAFVMVATGFQYLVYVKTNASSVKDRSYWLGWLYWICTLVGFAWLFYQYRLYGRKADEKDQVKRESESARADALPSDH